MANFDFDLLRLDMAEKTGYKLFLDYGEIGEDLQPYRKINEIVTPVVGVFRLTPVPLTALTTPYIAVVTATVEIPAPTELVEDVRDKLNEVAGQYNATTAEIKHGGTSYTVVYSFETCVLGDKRRDVSLYSGEIIPVSQTVTYTIIEQGITALDVSLKIDGMPVPFLRLNETRLATSETAPNAEGHGEIAVTQEMYGLTIETPLVKNALGELLCDMLSKGEGNKAHAVEVTRNGESHAYIMAVGSAASAMNPPANIGVTLSLAELNPTAAKFNDLWTVTTKTGEVVALSLNGGVIAWGDGTTSCGEGYMVHVYTDGRKSHEVYKLEYSNNARFGVIQQGVSLFGKMIRPKDGKPVDVDSLPYEVLNTLEGDKIEVNSQIKLEANVYGFIYVLSSGTTGSAVFDKPVMSLLRGTVAEVNTDLIEYDRWAVSEEV